MAERRDRRRARQSAAERSRAQQGAAERSRARQSAVGSPPRASDLRHLPPHRPDHRHPAGAWLSFRTARAGWRSSVAARNSRRPARSHTARAGTCRPTDQTGSLSTPSPRSPPPPSAPTPPTPDRPTPTAYHTFSPRLSDAGRHQALRRHARVIGPFQRAPFCEPGCRPFPWRRERAPCAPAATVPPRLRPASTLLFRTVGDPERERNRPRSVPRACLDT